MSEELYNNIMENIYEIDDEANYGRNLTEETLFLMSIHEMVESIIRGGNISLEDCLSENEVNW